MNSLERRDVITGTVYAETKKGVLISSDQLPADSVCFCPGCLTKGDTAMFTIQNYTYSAEGTKILLSFDSMIKYADAA
ncbi:MAG: hypothetical protein ACI4I1_11040 [Oscillospiraceae bacterium]